MSVVEGERKFGKLIFFFLFLKEENLILICAEKSD